MGLFGASANPYEDLFKRIEKGIKLSLKATLSGSTLSTMQVISSTTAHSVTAGQIVGDYILAPTPARKDLLPSADYWSRYAINTLGGEPLWLRTYDDEAATIKVSNSWGWEFGPQVDQNLLVWDWRLPLLAYLKALAARLAVIRVVDPEVDAAHRAEILGYATFLRSIEQRIRAGFSKSVPIAYPGYDFWLFNAPDSCGVVEVHSGFGDVAYTWTPIYWFRDQIGTEYYQDHGLPDNHHEYLKWHDHVTGIRYWRLYDSLGLFSFWTLIADVQAAAEGRPGAAGSAVLKGLYDLSEIGDVSGVFKLRIDAFTKWSDSTRSVVLPDEDD